MNNTVSSDTLAEPAQSVLIAFQIGRTISILCIIFGSLGNIALISVISYTSFHRVPYGILIVFIAIFDLIRLFSIAFYYILQAEFIPLTLSTFTIFVSTYRYPKMVTNWLKVFLAIERLIAMKYWLIHRYNVHKTHMTIRDRLRQRRTLIAILILLLCSLISQHPNFIPNRFISTCFDRLRLLIVNIPNPNYYYGNQIFNGSLFIIISYIILDDFLPIITLIICNFFLVYKLHHLPTITNKKLKESIWILFFLTILSIFSLPRSFIVLFNLYINSQYVDSTKLAIVFHTLQGFEMINNASTGYTCFLSCRILRKGLLRIVQRPFKKVQSKLGTNNSSSTSPELHDVISTRF